MYPLTIGLVIENKELWEEIKDVLKTLPFRTVLEQADVGDWAEFLNKVDRIRPDVLLFDISKSTTDLEEQIRRIRSLAIAPAFFAVDACADPARILRAIRGGAAEFLHPPLADPLQAALAKIADAKSTQQVESRGGGK